MKTVYFVSVIRALDHQATSTYIMTASLINGLKQNGVRVVFFAICEHDDEYEIIKDYYSDENVIVLPIPSRIGHDSGNIRNLLHILVHSVYIHFYCRVIDSLIDTIEDYTPDIVISHAPSFESICYLRALKKQFPQALYYEYWSDPMALSGILPENLGVKRWPFVWAEHRALRYADSIVFGTKSLMKFQQRLYSDMAEKMKYIDIPYTDKGITVVDTIKKNRLIYAGNYYSNIRNIEPLIEALSMMPDYELDVYGSGDYSGNYAKNVTFHGRIPPEDLNQIEKQYDCKICILNYSCIQIPGKIFYDTNKPVKILVIVDGFYSDDVLEYLESYNRFIFCKNQTSEIIKAISTLNSYSFDLEWINDKYSPKKIALDLLNGGNN